MNSCINDDDIRLCEYCHQEPATVRANILVLCTDCGATFDLEPCITDLDMRLKPRIGGTIKNGIDSCYDNKGYIVWFANDIGLLFRHEAYYYLLAYDEGKYPYFYDRLSIATYGPDYVSHNTLNVVDIIVTNHNTIIKKNKCYDNVDIDKLVMASNFTYIALKVYNDNKQLPGAEDASKYLPKVA